LYVGPGSVTIGDSVITESVTGKLVLPGVTRATTLFADEIEETGDQTRTWSTGPYLLDAYQFSVASGTSIPDPSYTPAEYTIDAIDDDGYIDGITIDPPGTWTQAVADINRRNSMYAYIGTNIQEPFNPANWVTIPFIVDSKANDVEYEFEGGADLGSFTFDGNQLEVESGTDIYIATFETDGPGESRLVLKPQEDDDGDNPTRIEGSYGVGIWANNTDSDNIRKWLFGTDGDLKLPAGGDIVDSTGSSVLGGNANTGNVVFDGNQMYVGGTGFLNLETDTGVAVIGTNGPQPLLVSINESDKIWSFDPGGGITFPDNTVQTTAYTGQSGGSSTVVRQDTAPTAANGTLWFNTVEGRLYIKYSDVWVDAAPLMMPAPDTDIDVNSITFADATTLTSAYTNKLVNGVHEVVLNANGDLLLSNDLIIPRGGRWIKDCDSSGGTTSMRWHNVPIDLESEVELLRVYTGDPDDDNSIDRERGRISLGWQNSNISGLSITAFDRTAGETEHKWRFLGDGSLRFPGTSEYRIREDEPGLVVTSELGVAITTNSEAESSKTWIFTPNGTLMLPGAVVNSTQAKTGGTVPAPIALDLTKTVNKLIDGVYSLADGVEGQIMYLVQQTGTVYDAVTVIVANARVSGILYTALEHYPFSYATGSVDIDTLIYTDGAWQAVGGDWD
jgi:hypothetical protein